MTDSGPKCEVCLTGHATRKVRAGLKDDTYCYYCNTCTEMMAEPYSHVLEYITFHPPWTIPDEIIDTPTWTPDDGYTTMDEIIAAQQRNIL